MNVGILIGEITGFQLSNSSRTCVSLNNSVGTTTKPIASSGTPLEKSSLRKGMRVHQKR